MDEREELIAWVRTVLTPAETALHDGDAAPRRALWSPDDPVALEHTSASVDGVPRS
jgi:hypothetical protein